MTDPKPEGSEESIKATSPLLLQENHGLEISVDRRRVTLDTTREGKPQPFFHLKQSLSLGTELCLLQRGRSKRLGVRLEDNQQTVKERLSSGRITNASEMRVCTILNKHIVQCLKDSDRECHFRSSTVNNAIPEGQSKSRLNLTCCYKREGQETG
jgi:hypothetical protein